ncbi:MAG: glycosyltransferase [Candidatus Competibacteraceae bacterium]
MAYGFGGAERTTANLLDHLDRSRIRRITMLAPAALRPYLPEAYDTFLDAGEYGLGGGFTIPGDLYRSARTTGTILRETTPDVALGMMHYASALVVLGARLAGIRMRTVASYRGPFYEYMRHHERGFRRRWFLRAAVTGTALLADRVIVPSRGTAGELRRRFLVPAARTLVIPNGIDLGAATSAAVESVPELADLDQDEWPVLCAIARLSPEKNLGLLLEAFRRVRSVRPVTLLILGDGPERTMLETRIADWGLAGAVRLLGYRANVYPYLRRADLFIHTCQFEGFGYTVLEALACGTTVVATDCPHGPREVLDNGNYGVLVPPGDPGALAAAVLQLLADPSRRRSLAARGLERAATLSIQRMVGAYEAEFLRLADG